MLEGGMEAPAGPERAEAERLRLDKPEEGAWTMSWVSTVSPRAAERETAETVPGASVCPTRTKLDATHTGNAAVCWMPLPVRAMTAGEFVALLATDMLPVALPTFAGAKATLIVAD
jgi:hypothetical protein